MTDILNDCDFFQEQIAALIIKADTLREQAEQARKKIEQESSKEPIISQYVETVPKFSTQKIVGSALVIASSLLILGFRGWIIKQQSLELQQMNLILPQKPYRILLAQFFAIRQKKRVLSRFALCQYL